MRGSKLLIIMLAVMFGTFMAHCNGDGNGEDDVEEEGDGEEMDVADEDAAWDDMPEDDVPEDVPVEDVTVEDMPTEEVTPDMPTEEGPGECVEAVIACDETLTDQTTIGKPDRMNVYSCADALDESGGEAVYSLTTDAHMFVTVTLTINTAGEDMDLFLMTGECDPESMCIGYSAGTGPVEAVEFESMPGETYYIIVDGWSEAAADFDIAVACKIPEICDNDVDDNDNGLVDCEDPDCYGYEACIETDCGNDVDDDEDGLTDCEDGDCFDDDACVETQCGDGLDNDDNGLIDCWDPDCIDDEGCTETECDDEEDNDHDGFADCLDYDCIEAEAENCSESDCDDDVDNDGDGDTDCEDWECYLDEDGACATGDGAVGDACASHADCASGQCLMEWENGWPGGTCVTLSYDDDCTTLECPEGSTCVSFGMFGPYGCLAECGDGCREGYDCFDMDDDTTGDICVPGCDDDDQCVETGFCDIPEDADTGNCGIPPEVCDNELDDDSDDLTDCDDPDCWYDDDCAEVTALDGGDHCGEATAITLPEGERGSVAVTGTTTGAADMMHLDCLSSDGLDVVYSFTLEDSAFVIIDMIGGPDEPMHPDTALSLRKDCRTVDLLCNDDFTAYYHSRVGGSISAGTYYVICDSFGDASGDFTLGIRLSDLP